MKDLPDALPCDIIILIVKILVQVRTKTFHDIYDLPGVAGEGRLREESLGHNFSFPRLSLKYVQHDS